VEVQKRYEEIRRLGAEVLVISQGRPEPLAAFVRERPLPFPVVGDPDRAAYRAFGLERTSWTTILSPRVLLGYVRVMARGWLPRKPNEGEDVLQLGGDFVLDAEGRLGYSHPSAEPTDRPTIEMLLSALAHATAKAAPADSKPLPRG
jgi:hypothetical protein